MRLSTHVAPACDRPAEATASLLHHPRKALDAGVEVPGVHLELYQRSRPRLVWIPIVRRVADHEVDPNCALREVEPVLRLFPGGLDRDYQPELDQLKRADEERRLRVRRVDTKTILARILGTFATDSERPRASNGTACIFSALRDRD